MDLAFVDKLAKVNNGVKYLLLGHYSFDRTVDAKGMKTKGSKTTVRAFSSMITKRIFPRKSGLTRGQSLLEKIFLMVKEYKSTLQGVRPRLHLLNVQYNP